MSMLAEKRRKTKYVINPTRKPLWATDSNGIKFGKELMEKMGWSAGKGLGANEQGIQEPLRVSYKNDNKGMGFKGNEEKWIEYQDDFNCLLNQLASNSDTSVKAKGSEKNEVISLEEKSKHSKARVHYQKFTRGKDLSKYTEKDLSCILGTGKKKKEKENETIEEEPPSNNNNTCETSFGVTTINSGSYKDYFKKKWTNNNKLENSSAELYSTGFDEHQISEIADEVEAKKSNKRHTEGRDEWLDHENGKECTENVGKEIRKHKKKRKNLDLKEEVLTKKERNVYLHKNDAQSQKTEYIQSVVNDLPSSTTGDCIEDVCYKNKKRKKRESEEVRVEECTGQEDQTDAFVFKENSVKKKKKKRKPEEKMVEECTEQTEGCFNDDSLVKKKKKKKRSNESEKEKKLNEEFSEVVLAEEKRKKKYKEKAEDQFQSEAIKNKGEMDKKKEREKENKYEHSKGEGKTLENQEKMSKRKKDEAKSEMHSESDSTCDTSKEKEKRAKGESKDKSKEGLIHTHKTVLFQTKKPILDGFKKCSTTKALKLICGAEIEKFKGSNLGKIPGYGCGGKGKTDGELR